MVKKVAKKAAEVAKKPVSRPAAKTKKRVLLSGDNPQISKSMGDAPVQTYISAIPGWKSDLAKRLDGLIVKAVPKLCKGVKWNSPFYGTEGKGWFLSFHCFKKYIKVGFFRGADLTPVPPGVSSQKNVRYLDIYEEDELNEKQFVQWVKQASRLPGEKL